MNERIRELVLQAREYATTRHPVSNITLSVNSDLFEQKFAELIVRECVGICEGKTDHLDPNMYEVWRGALACASDIKVHFGVLE
jgi:hypothetical protein